LQQLASMHGSHCVLSGPILQPSPPLLELEALEKLAPPALEDVEDDELAP
jgi:hypothetical protein